MTDTALELADRIMPDVHAPHSNVPTIGAAFRATLAEYDAKKIPMPDELVGAYRIIVARMIASPHPRVQRAGAKMIREALGSNIRLAEVLLNAEKPAVAVQVNNTIQVRRIVVEREPERVEAP